MLEYCLERTLPTLAKRRNPEGAFQLLARMSWQIQESIYLSHGDPFWTIGDFYDVIARTNFPFLQHAKIKPWSVMCYEQRRHSRFIHADAHAVAGHARLCHFKYRITNAVSITDADLVIRKPFNSEVFAELTETEIIATQEALPVMVGVHLVDKYGAVLPSVTREIPLRITFNIELANYPPSLDWRFPDGRSDSLAVPRHVARKTDIY